MALDNFVPDVANQERTGPSLSRRRLQFPICSIVVQIALIALMGKFTDYPDDAHAASIRACDIARHVSKEPQGIRTALVVVPSLPYHELQGLDNCNYDENAVNVFGAAYQDTQFFIVAGISLLFVGIRHHSLSSMTLTLFLISICLQWSFLCRGFLRLDSNLHPIKPSPDVFVITIFFAEAVLISWGVVLGRTSRMQLLVMTMLEIPFATVNDYILLEVLKAQAEKTILLLDNPDVVNALDLNSERKERVSWDRLFDCVKVYMLKMSDPSGAVIYNVFGTYFGLSMARILYNKGESQHEEKRKTTVYSETLAFLGSNILWIFFPTAMGAIFVKDRRLRCIINTYFALTGSAVTGIVVGMLLDPKGKMTPSHVQNATISSAVTMCAIADAMMGIYTAVIIGCITGTISIFTSVYFQPFLANKWHIVDACASNTLHGFPGILGGIISAILAYLATETEYGASLYDMYPARAPRQGTEELLSLQEFWPHVKAGEGRSASLQAAYQIACVGITIAISISSGILTGMLMRLNIFDQLNEEEFYEDCIMWNMPTGDLKETKKDEEDDQVIQESAPKKIEKYTQTLFDTQKITNMRTHL